MICERCGEIGETLMTEHHGELCEACQQEVEQKQSPPPRRAPGAAAE